MLRYPFVDDLTDLLSEKKSILLAGNLSVCDDIFNTYVNLLLPVDFRSFVIYETGVKSAASNLFYLPSNQDVSNIFKSVAIDYLYVDTTLLLKGKIHLNLILDTYFKYNSGSVTLYLGVNTKEDVLYFYDLLDKSVQQYFHSWYITSVKDEKLVKEAWGLLK